jgi:hypothetical protein
MSTLGWTVQLNSVHEVVLLPRSKLVRLYLFCFMIGLRLSLWIANGHDFPPQDISRRISSFEHLGQSRVPAQQVCTCLNSLRCDFEVSSSVSDSEPAACLLPSVNSAMEIPAFEYILSLWGWVFNRTRSDQYNPVFIEMQLSRSGVVIWNWPMHFLYSYCIKYELFECSIQILCVPLNKRSVETPRTQNYVEPYLLVVFWCIGLFL